MSSYNTQEQQVIRYLEAKYIDRRNRPMKSARGVSKQEIMEDCSLDEGTYYRVIARLQADGLAHTTAQGAVGEFLNVHDSIVEVIQRIDAQAPVESRMMSDSEVEAFAKQGLLMEQGRVSFIVPEVNPLFRPTYMIRAFIAGPSDVKEARQEAATAIHDWNAAHTMSQGVIVLPVGEDHARAETGGHPQDLLNRQLLEGCALLIAIFGSRLGTPTNTAPSGTVQEIRDFIAVNKGGEVMPFFSTKPHPHDVDQDNLDALRTFRHEMQKQWLYKEFGEGEFPQLVRQQLAQVMNKLIETLKPPLKVTMPPQQTNERTPRQLVVDEFKRLTGEFQKKWPEYEKAHDEELARRFLANLSKRVWEMYQAQPDAIQHFLKNEIGETTAKMQKHAETPTPASFDVRHFWSTGERLLREFVDFIEQIETL